MEFGESRENYLDASHSWQMSPKGKILAEKLYERHHYFEELLISAGIDEKTANEEACHLEYILSGKSYHLRRKIIIKEKEESCSIMFFLL